MTVKKITGKIHLWLGLASGLIVFVVALSGCLLVFEEEISGLFGYGVFKKAAKQAVPFAPPSKVFSVADSVLQDKRIARTYYTMYTGKPTVNVLWALDSSRQYHAVLQDPYSGRLVGNYEYRKSFFAIVTHIHTSLALGTVGTAIISYATLIFVVLMITGLILWKPASKKGYKQRFTIKWKSSAKRVTYDLHNVLGFYMTWVAIFIAVTGLVWSFEWMNNSVQWVANGGKKVVASDKKLVSDTLHLPGGVWHGVDYKVVDHVFQNHLNDQGSIHAIRIYKPAMAADVIRVQVETIKGVSYARADEYAYDQYSGKLLGVQLFGELSNGEKLRRMNYYIHVGSIGGLTGKLLAFFGSLIAASLPVTGFLVWKGRRKKSTPKKNVPLTVSTGITKG